SSPGFTTWRLTGNFPGLRGDSCVMTCEPWREAISATADGEPAAIDSRLVAAHLASCPGCRAFAANLHELRRATAVSAAPQLNDLSADVVRAARAYDRRSVWWVLRL